jgi:heavy metal translocating P-type ATPase
MLIEVGFLVSAYVGKRLFDKLRHRHQQAFVVQKSFNQKLQSDLKNGLPLIKRSEKLTQSTETQSIEIHSTETQSIEIPDKTDKVFEHHFKVSLVSLVVSFISQFFYAPLKVISLCLFMYGGFPYMRETEEALIEKRKIDSNVSEAIAMLGCVATNQYFAFAIMQMYYYFTQKMTSKLEDKSKGMLLNVFDQQPGNQVWVLKEHLEIEIPLEALQINDIVIVKGGEVVPVDGIVTDGMATVDQHALTGESQPVEKEVGDHVFACTLMMTGRLCVKVEKAGKDTSLAKIEQILNNTLDFKTTTQLKGEQWAEQGVFPQLGLTSLALLTVGPLGAMAILNSNFGYRVKLIAPLQTLKHLNLASQQGILIKDGRSLELLTQVDTILFDKTGTLTQEEPEVGRVIVCAHYQEEELLTYAAAAERQLTHPIAKAILNKAQKYQLTLPEVEDSNYQMGYGLTVSIDNKIIQVGSVRFMGLEGISIPKVIEEEMALSFNQGHSLVMVAIDHQLCGALEIQPSIRPEITEMISGLRERGIKHLAIVSGDHRQPTQKLAEELGMDSYFYEVLPENKASIVEELQKQGRLVCFIGDGINDAIAMKKAQVSISLRGATSVATDLAQIVLMDGSLSHLCGLFDIAKNLETQLRTGLIMSIAPLPIVVAGGFLFHFGVLSSIVVNQIGVWSGVSYAMSAKLKREKTALKVLPDKTGALGQNQSHTTVG